jgi:hypothetical protein
MIEVPQVAQPRQVAATAKALADREADLTAAEAAVRAASAQIEEARGLDNLLLADALDEGRVVGTPNADEARRELAEAERLAAAHRLRRDRGAQALEEALAASTETWTDALVRAIEKSEAETLKLLDDLDAALRARAGQRAGLAWLRRRVAGQKMAPLKVGPIASTLRRNANSTACWSVDELLQFVRDGVTETTMLAAADRDAVRAATG